MHWLPLAVLAFASLPQALNAQTALDSTIERRLVLAEKTVTFPSRIRGATASPRWIAGRDNFLYRFTAGPVTRWALMDPRRNEAQLLFTDREVPPEMMQAIQSASISIPWTYNSEPAGGFRLSLPGGSVVFDGMPAINVGRWIPGGAQSTLRVMGGRLVGLAANGDTMLNREPGSDRSWEVPSGCWSSNRDACVVFLNDAQAVHRLPLIDYSNPLERVTNVPYPKAGTPISETTVYVFHPARRKLLRVTSDSTAYFWFAGWRPKSSEFLLLRLERTGKTLELLAVNESTGQSRVVVRETNPDASVAGLEFSFTNVHQVRPLPDGERFLWMSDRDGWRHVYLYRFDGSLERQVTRGSFPVRNVMHVDPRRGELFVLAAGDTTRPYDIRVYRASLSRYSWHELTSELGSHTAWVRPDGEYFVDTWSSVTEPARSVLRDRNGRILRILERADTSGLGATGYTPPEVATVRAADDSTQLSAVLYRPADFDSRKRYPIIDLIYGGPPFNAVPNTFAGSIFSPEASALAQMGFIVAVIDARGTPGRSRKFRDAIYGRVGELEIADHVAALRQLAATRPYLDTTRVGITGYSWGGYYALHAMLAAPSVFKAGYAGAPGDFTSDAFVNEPHLGLPGESAEAYARGDNTALASNLNGALKIAHGTADTNAPFSNTMRMVTALIRAGKQFELLVLPNENHALAETRAYYRNDVRRFFVRHLGSESEVPP